MNSFSFDMCIDQEGIIIVKMSGIFDFEKWLSMRQQFLKTRFTNTNFSGRPSIIDVLDSQPPIENWRYIFTKVQIEQSKVNEGTGPIAFVVGDDPSNAIATHFFRAIGETRSKHSSQFREFKDVVSAYDWLMKNDSWKKHIETLK